MKLYVYDHCPFCVRARMIFGLKNVAVEEFAILNDDETTPIGLIGRKAVPILVKDDGSAMPESLDIVHYVDSHFGEKLLADDVRPEITEWIKKVGEYYNHLLVPRFAQMALPELATQSAVDYFTSKKQEHYGDFAENLAETDEYLVRLHQDLAELEPLIQGEYVSGKPSLEDILLFPVLRNLSCVKGLVYPEKIAHYVERMGHLSQVNLYYSQAI